MARLYSDVAWVLDEVRERRAGLKGLVYQNYGGSRMLGRIYALSCETLKYTEVLDELFAKAEGGAEFLEQANSKSLALVMAYDLLFGSKKKIEGGGALKRSLVDFQPALQKALDALMKSKSASNLVDLLPAWAKPEGALPRYVRVNTIFAKTDDVQKEYRARGIECEADELIPDLLVLPAGTDLHECPLVKANKVVLQDRASCLPAYVLSQLEGVDPKWRFLDSCAAPGNKTTHLAMLTTGRIDAFERDQARSRTLTQRASRYAPGRITVHTADFLGSDPKDFADVRGMVCDPSCSGSGLVHRLDHAMHGGTQDVAKLAAFQLRILRHALSFPALEALVYSTCSIHATENEDVVADILPFARHMGFELADALPEWPLRGESQALPRNGKGCLRSGAAAKTHGFFVAAFRRVRPAQEGEAPGPKPEKKTPKKKAAPAQTESAAAEGASGRKPGKNKKRKRGDGAGKMEAKKPFVVKLAKPTKKRRK